MIIYVIIYHIRNNKNCNIDIGIKHNTIVSTIILTVYINILRGRRKEKESMLYSINNT